LDETAMIAIQWQNMKRRMTIEIEQKQTLSLEAKAIQMIEIRVREWQPNAENHQCASLTRSQRTLEISQRSMKQRPMKCLQSCVNFSREKTHGMIDSQKIIGLDEKELIKNMKSNSKGTMTVQAEQI
jgi:hypothetical protein